MKYRLIMAETRRMSRRMRKQSSFEHVGGGGDMFAVHKLKEYRNLMKIESANPSIQGSIVPINQIVNFQDTEFKDIMNFTGKKQQNKSIVKNLTELKYHLFIQFELEIEFRIRHFFFGKNI